MKATRQTRREAKRLFRLCLVDHVLDEQRVQQVVRQVSAAKSRNRLAILWQFQRLTRLYVTRHTASVKSPLPLPTDVQGRIETGLTQVYGPALETSFTEHPELIGGLRIQVGNDVYDGSIQAGLAALGNGA